VRVAGALPDAQVQMGQPPLAVVTDQPVVAQDIENVSGALTQ
jgi:hypothetical protein